MGKRKSFADAAQEAADHQRRAKEIRNKAAFTEVVGILKKFPDAAEGALKSLNDTGFFIDRTADTGPKSRACEAIEERSAKKKNQTCAEHAALEAQVPHVLEVELVPKKLTKLEELTVPALTHQILKILEPSSLSPANVRSMSLKGLQDGLKVELLRLVDYATGVPKDQPLCGPYRVWAFLQDHLKEQAEWRGRRARDIALPLDWSINGVFRAMVDSKGRALITQQRTDVTKTVPESRVPQTFQASDLHVAFNWSESRAALYFFPGTASVPINIHELFAASDHIVPSHRSSYENKVRQGTAGMEMMAIEDFMTMTPKKTSSLARQASAILLGAFSFPKVAIGNGGPGDEASGSEPSSIAAGDPAGHDAFEGAPSAAEEKDEETEECPEEKDASVDESVVRPPPPPVEGSEPQA